MTPREVLFAARCAGVRLRVDGDFEPELAIEAHHQPSAELIDLLREHKAEIIKLLIGPRRDFAGGPGCLLMLHVVDGHHRQCGAPLEKSGIYCDEHSGVPK